MEMDHQVLNEQRGRIRMQMSKFYFGKFDFLINSMQQNKNKKHMIMIHLLQLLIEMKPNSLSIQIY